MYKTRGYRSTVQYIHIEQKYKKVVWHVIPCPCEVTTTKSIHRIHNKGGMCKACTGPGTKALYSTLKKMQHNNTNTGYQSCS